MFLSVHYASPTVSVASPTVSPVGQRTQPPASLPIEDVVQINNGEQTA